MVVDDFIDWHWAFLLNIPIGIAVFIICSNIFPKDRAAGAGTLDVWGAVTVTAALMLAVYGIVNGNSVGWVSSQTLGTLVVAVILFIIFLAIEMSVQSPLMPLSLLKIRNVSVSSSVGILWSASMFAWFFLSALYMQLVLMYTPLEVGLAFLPANLIMAALSLGLSAKIVNRFGLRWPLVIGMTLVAIGLALFSRAPVAGIFMLNVLPGMLLLGLGAGLAFNPVLLAAMSDVSESESGLASGVVNTSFMMGGALGLAILASLASARSLHLSLQGVDHLAALTGGYDAAFLTGAVFAVIAALTALLLREPRDTAVLNTSH